ncbi:MAG: hypothetical protein LBI99_06105, partial [Propionibacteriaceae bacterium]|nr:hypothetical protein [Propionibacteriaceae bacterium]
MIAAWQGTGTLGLPGFNLWAAGLFSQADAGAVEVGQRRCGEAPSRVRLCPVGAPASYRQAAQAVPRLWF